MFKSHHDSDPGALGTVLGAPAWKLAFESPGLKRLLFSVGSFDESSILRAEMARKNMYLRDDQSTKRPRVSAYEVTGVTPQGYAPVTNNRDNPPCNTLFIGNLSDTVRRLELEGLFAHQPVRCHSPLRALFFCCSCAGGLTHKRLRPLLQIPTVSKRG